LNIYTQTNVQEIAGRVHHFTNPFFSGKLTNKTNDIPHKYIYYIRHEAFSFS